MNDFIKRAAKTAISRHKISAPTMFLLKQGLISKDKTILDYGCGYGKDTEVLKSLGFNVVGYDPNYFPNSLSQESEFDIVICNYVFNVLPITYEAELLFELHRLGKEVYITVRNDVKKEGPTKKGTYQRIVEFKSEVATLLHKTSSYKLYRKN
jgi:DNA phosphorothioation-associated putative methyltransferase